MDNPKDTGHPDRDLINVHQDYELRYWCKKWAITADQLRQAAKRAQPSESVRKIQEAAIELGFIKHPR